MPSSSSPTRHEPDAIEAVLRSLPAEVVLVLQQRLLESLAAMSRQLAAQVEASNVGSPDIRFDATRPDDLEWRPAGRDEECAAEMIAEVLAGARGPGRAEPDALDAPFAVIRRLLDYRVS
jgi:hypothetical protein